MSVLLLPDTQWVGVAGDLGSSRVRAGAGVLLL